jgi:hypothetical protein
MNHDSNLSGKLTREAQPCWPEAEMTWGHARSEWDVGATFPVRDPPKPVSLPEPQKRPWYLLPGEETDSDDAGAAPQGAVLTLGVVLVF